ncbi:MAG: PAS domain-containing protein, partial [Hyphomicrobiaceae bacterium]|nr:PAS domain-containing protein [Hyphomicrobiaceae bacterium]
MKQRTLQILYAYWDGLRAGRIAPLRLEVDPSRIGSILPEIFLLERLDATTYCYRLAGTRLCEIFGSELRGTNLLDGWTTADRAELERALTRTCDEGAATHIVMEACAGASRRVQLEALLLPLMHAGNAIERVLGAVSAVASPHWLGHDRLLT